MANRSPDKEAVGDYLKHLLVELGKIPPDRVVPGACLDGALKMESVVFVELQVALEDRFDIEIDPIEIIELNEFTAIVGYVYECIQRSILAGDR